MEYNDVRNQNNVGKGKNNLWESIIQANTHTERSINCGMHELFYVFQISFNDSEQNETIII